MSDCADCLIQIPDLNCWEQLESQCSALAEHSARVRPEQVDAVCWVSGTQLGVECPPPQRVFQGAFRRWVVAACVADWGTYSEASDRVDLVRLLFVMNRFPVGFRVMLGHLTAPGGPTSLRLAGQEVPWVPLGYTGYYPIDADIFRGIHSGGRPPEDRAFLPLPAVPLEGGCLYLFNYGVVPGFRGTPYSSALMRAYADELEALRPAGLAAIAVSSDGVRVAHRFGLSKRSEFSSPGGVKECVLTGSEAELSWTKKD